MTWRRRPGPCAGGWWMGMVRAPRLAAAWICGAGLAAGAGDMARIAAFSFSIYDYADALSLPATRTFPVRPEPGLQQPQRVGQGWFARRRRDGGPADAR